MFLDPDNRSPAIDEDNEDDSQQKPPRGRLGEMGDADERAVSPRHVYIVTWMLTTRPCRRVYGETGLWVVDRNDFTYRRKRGRISQPPGNCTNTMRTYINIIY